MELTHEVCSGLGIALNEATLVSVAVDETTWTTFVTVAVLTLTEKGPAPDDNRCLLVLKQTGRIAASLRHGAWSDPDAAVEAFPLARLTEAVESFGQGPIYGWKFFNVPEADDFARWSDRVSLDVLTGTGALEHTLGLFQEDGASRILKLQFWFDTLEIRGPDGTQQPLDEFIASGVRWWDALHDGDTRTSGAGIIPFA